MEHNDATSSRLSRRSLLAASALAGAGGAALAVRSAVAQEGTPSPVAEEATFLFVQSGFSSGLLDKATDGVESWLLVLQDAPEQTAFFSDRPARIAGVMPTAQFLETLDFSADDPPNAALVIDTENGAAVVILELTQPAYDAEAATLTYITRILEVDVLVTSGFGFATDPLGPNDAPGAFGPASLFIDSLLGCSPWDPRC